MKIIDFIFSKISAHKGKDFTSSNVNINITFTDVQKHKFEMKDIEVYKIYFKFSVIYQDSSKNSDAELNFEGAVVVSLSKDEAKELTKSWKKKELPSDMRNPVFNLILKKCSVKSLVLEEDLKLPSHIPLPKISQK